MTIAAAYVCSDGIVFAVDGEYSGANEKYEGEKLFPIARGGWSMLIAGAGNMDLVRMVVDDFEHEFAESDGLSHLRQKLIDRTRYFADHYIVDRDDPNMQLLLLVGIQMKSGERQLFRVNGALVVPVEGSDFIGAGAEVARSTSSWLFDPAVTTKVMMPVALNILYWVKKHVIGCGQSTYVRVLPKDLKPNPTVGIYEDSNFFWDLNDLLRPVILGCLESKLKDDDFERRLTAFVDKMRAVRVANKVADTPFPGAPPMIKKD